MLNEAVVEGFLDCRFEDMELEFPRIYPNNALVGIFCQYVEGNYYEWLKDRIKSFFDHGEHDWEWVKKRVNMISKED